MPDIFTTITKDIENISYIKSELNDLLRENGIEGGPVFNTYPEKFRSLFRILDGRTEEDVYNLPASESTITSSVPKPILVRRENSNTFYLYCANDAAQIYYTMKSEHLSIGERLYTQHGLLTIKEDTYITAYAKVREVESELAWWNVVWLREDIPLNPEFSRDGTTVTITCDTEDAIIWYRVGESGSFTQYTQPITNVPRTSNVYAYSSNLSHQSSEIVVDEAPEQLQIPHTPTISQNANEIIVDSDEDDVTLYWRKTDSTEWNEYEDGDEITESGYYIAVAMRDGVMSEWSTPVQLTYYPTPAVPTYQQNINTVVMNCSTNGATIYYKKSGTSTWIEYTGPFELTETMTVTMKSVLGPKESAESSPVTLTYIPKPATPDIDCTANVVTITCDTTGASIYYRINQSGDWYSYIVPFEISTTTLIEAMAVKEQRESDVAVKLCDYSLIQRPATPTIVCSNNTVTLYTPTSGATMYYRIYGTSAWTQYTQPFTISETNYYEAKSVKDGVDSLVSAPVLCQYVSEPAIKPDAPVISLYNNVVTIISPTAGATILWAESGSTQWNAYTGPFAINRDMIIVAKCVNANGESPQSYLDCKYIPTIPVPVITCTDNIVEMYDTYPGTTVWYRKSGTMTWIEYTQAFYIEETTTFEAKATYKEFESAITSKECVFDESQDPVWNFYRMQYLTVENVDDKEGKLYVHKYLENISYSRDGGEFWEPFWPVIYDPVSGRTNYKYTKIKPGEKILLRGENRYKFPGTGYPESIYNFKVTPKSYQTTWPGGYTGTGVMNPLGTQDGAIFTTIKAKIYGNVGSIVNKYYFKEDVGTAPWMPYLFWNNPNLVDCSNVVLPWMTLRTYCYESMFERCRNITISPLLPAKTLRVHSYFGMFWNCSSLNNVRCLGEKMYYTENTNLETATLYWLGKTSNNGTFTKSSNSTWTTGESGIPTDWTVINV